MNPFEMVVVIVMICVIGSVLKSRRGRRKSGELKEMMSDMMGTMDLGMDYYSKKKLDPYLAKIQAMEERIQVLERIATDKGRNLAAEIDGLK